MELLLRIKLALLVTALCYSPNTLVDGFFALRRGLQRHYSHRVNKATITKSQLQNEISHRGVSLHMGSTVDDIFFYNTLSREKEKFTSLADGKVSFYSCGPTVYDYAHIGNFRAFLTYDMIKRWLLYCGYEVDHVCNLTDIDDKIIIKMIAEGKSLQDITNKYTNAFFDDLNVLNIIKARAYPKATEHIADIESMIQRLTETGYAYITNGSVYFRVSAFSDYGKFANLNFDQMEEGAGGFGPNERRGTDEKESSRDFALWKAVTEQDSDVSWESVFGKGRPGWHIECSAMCNKLLGPTVDIHAGGVDLVFPHHQNEIAQSEAFSGQQFSRFWMHNGFVNIDDEKMSKSLKNFKTLRDIVTEPNDARAFRYMVVTNQYRNTLNFNEETLKSARNSLKRIDKLVVKLKDTAGMKNIADPSICERQLKEAEDAVAAASTVTATAAATEEGESLVEVIAESTARFESAMSDDLNTPQAIAALFKIINFAEKLCNAETMTAALAVKVLSSFRAMDSVFGVLYNVPVTYFTDSLDVGSAAAAGARLRTLLASGKKVCSTCNCGKKDAIDAAVISSSSSSGIVGEDELVLTVKGLAEKRMTLKAEKKYQEADAIRDEITTLGFGVKDRKDGFDIFVL